jgi:drug/metabolite transporter (DMT)-like permease
MRADTVPEVSVLRQPPSRLAASVQAVLVVFVWATSWILIKGKLHDIPALSLAGLRYGLAFVCLLALLLGRPALRSSVVALPRRSWLRLGTLGLLLSGLTQATVFLGLYRLPAVTVSLLLSLTPALVTVLAIPLLGRSLRLCRAVGCCCRWPGCWCTSDRSRCPPVSPWRSVSWPWV